MKLNSKSFTLVAGLVAIALVAGLMGYNRLHRSATAERKVLFYQDSMHPWIKSDKPGKCTICAMDLTPIYEGETGAGAGANLVVLSSNGITVLNVQTDEVKTRPLTRSLRVAGTLEASETSKTVISAPARGRIDALTVDYAGVEVELGQKLLTMFSPELVQIRRTLLAVRQPNRTNVNSNLPDIYGGSDIYSGDILAPLSGVVLERNVYLGQYVAEGDKMLTIVDPSVLWFRFDVYQNQLPWFQVGQPIEVVVPGIPGKTFPAFVSFAEPSFNDATRTVKVRAEIRNPLVETGGRKTRQLKFGMYAEGLSRAQAQVLAVPRTAILFRGGTAYAYLEKGPGAYERCRVKLGREGDQAWEVLDGLSEGDTVITSGNVLIDAQAQLHQEEEPEELVAKDMPMSAPANRSTLPAETQVPTITETAIAGLGLSTEAKTTQAPTSPGPTPPAGERTYAKSLAGGRTDRMRALMSPGGELQTVKRDAILAERAAMAAKTQTQPGSQEPMAMAGNAQGSQANPAALHTHMPEMGAAQDTSPAATSAAGAVPAAPASQLQPLLTAASAVSQALADDKVQSFNEQVARMPALVRAAEKDFAAPHPLSELVKAVSESAKFDSAKDLEQARKQFLPFSTAVVSLAKQVRKDDAAVGARQIYYCPMAPKPGLWIQAKGPLRNPYFGAEMLTCGQEVKQ